MATPEDGRPHPHTRARPEESAAQAKIPKPKARYKNEQNNCKKKNLKKLGQNPPLPSSHASPLPQTVTLPHQFAAAPSSSQARRSGGRPPPPAGAEARAGAGAGAANLEPRGPALPRGRRA